MTAFTALPTERRAGDAAASCGEGSAVQPWGWWGAAGRRGARREPPPSTGHAHVCLRGPSNPPLLIGAPPRRGADSARGLGAARAAGRAVPRAAALSPNGHRSRAEALAPIAQGWQQPPQPPPARPCQPPQRTNRPGSTPPAPPLLPAPLPNRRLLPIAACAVVPRAGGCCRAVHEPPKPAATLKLPAVLSVCVCRSAAGDTGTVAGQCCTLPQHSLPGREQQGDGRGGRSSTPQPRGCADAGAPASAGQRCRRRSSGKLLCWHRLRLYLRDFCQHGCATRGFASTIWGMEEASGAELG